VKLPQTPQMRAHLWVSGALGAAMLLHVVHVPVWITLIACLCVGWSIAARTGRLGLPGRFIRSTIVLALTLAVVFMFHTLNGLNAGSALLMVMGSMKLLEARSRRDRLIVAGCALFLLLAACLREQSLSYVPLYLLVAWLVCTALAIVSHPAAGASSRASLLLTARTLLYALPLALVLFAFFPRLPGSLWALPSSGGAVTGLSDTLSPGSISSLATSSDPAFRVAFDAAVPPARERYWRGPVLHDFDGERWTMSWPGFFRPETVERLGPRYDYRVTLTPSLQHWWFALDTVDDSPNDRVLLTADRQLMSSRVVAEATTYVAHSHTQTRATSELSGAARRRDVYLPPRRNPRSIALAQELRSQAPSDVAFVRSSLEWIRARGFAYTLTPPLTGRESVDDFLFRTRKGFCGHFASAFATLMRAGQVPARVITGYQGGEWNPIGGYFLVRQSDAHAWVEVWLEGQGWTRVDPTALVAPERLDRGIEDLLADAGSAPERLLHSLRWILKLEQTWDAAEAWWDLRIVDFDLQSQFALLAKLGFNSPGWADLGWALAAGLALWLLVLAWQFGRLPRHAPADRLARAYARLCAKLARVVIARAGHQGPLDYAAALCLGYPEVARTAGPLLNRYAELRYGPPRSGQDAAVAAFERAVSRLSLTAPRSRARASRGR